MICKYCGEEFEPRRASQVYCSAICKSRAKDGRRHPHSKRREYKGKCEEFECKYYTNRQNHCTILSDAPESGCAFLKVEK